MRGGDTLAVAALAGALVVPPSALWASPGDLDPSFGNRGTLLTPLSSGRDEGHAVVLQPDGKMVAVGSVESEQEFGLVRVDANGTLDLAFGEGGKVVTTIEGGGPAFAAALQPDGKIVAAGYAATGSRRVFALARYNPNGSLDGTFGGDGIVTTRVGTGDAGVRAIVLQRDGRLVAVGMACETFFIHCVFAVARYNTDGTLDASFASGGTVTTSAGQAEATANAVIIQDDGKIVAGGFAGDQVEGFLKPGVALVRYEPDGRLDRSFGKNGIVKTGFGLSTFGGDVANGLALQSDGKIIAAGSISVEVPGGITSIFGLARYDRNGALDVTFGNHGLVTNDFGSQSLLGSTAGAVVVQPDGKIIGAGSVDIHTSDFSLARYQADGAIDASFGNGGSVTAEITSFDDARAIALQSDGKIIALGFSFPGTDGLGDFALARFENAFCGDANVNGAITVTDGVEVLRAAAGLDSVCTRAACDTDGNGSVTVTDGVNVLRGAAGLPATLACGPPQ